MDMEIDKEENTEHVIIAKIGNESENKVVEKQNRRTCDIITINGRVGFLQKVSTNVWFKMFFYIIIELEAGDIVCKRMSLW